MHPIFREALESRAEDQGRPFGEMEREWAEERLRPEPRQNLSPEEWEAADQRIRRHFGAINSGDPRSADNDRIDADLAREYAGSLPERP
jgi:hypothetical protein